MPAGIPGIRWDIRILLITYEKNTEPQKYPLVFVEIDYGAKLDFILANPILSFV